MKLIVAIIRPERLDEVRAALAQCDVYLMTVSECTGFGKQRGVTEVYRGQELHETLLPKIKVEIAVSEPFVEATVDAIVRAARSGETGRVGDGKIFVLPMDDCIRIRTGESGQGAIGP
ncbi:MAG: P-II family nitrogen regulator [Phycisphaerales bacterium]|jgi:nitrogen regulatory protein P-II 1|nr:P-II family nitrogen regulator [Phycisphaerales bacterium]